MFGPVTLEDRERLKVIASREPRLLGHAREVPTPRHGRPGERPGERVRAALTKVERRARGARRSRVAPAR